MSCKEPKLESKKNHTISNLQNGKRNWLFLTDNWVTDDPTSSDIGVQIGLKYKIFTKCDNPEHEDKIHGVDQVNVNKIIQFGLREGYFKGHLELDEFYYHSTKKGLALLDSKTFEFLYFWSKKNNANL